MQPDPFKRTRHASQAYQVSYFGKSLETAQSGYGRRLGGSPISAIPLRMKGNATGLVLGDLTAGLWLKGLIVHSAGTGTIALSLAARETPALAAVPLIAAGSLTAPAELALLPAALAPLAVDRVLLATITGGDADEDVVVSLLVCPVTESWF